jgi:hypothetical protein
MQVTINNGPVTDMSGRIAKDLRLGAAQETVEGSVLDGATAVSKFTFRLRVVCFCVVGLFWVALYFMISMSNPGDRIGMGEFGLVLAVLLPFILWLAYYFRRRRLMASLPNRIQESPPAGTRVRVDESGLNIGGRFTAWSSVTINRIDFEAFYAGRGGGRAYMVHRIQLRSGGVVSTLDGTLLDQGRAILDSVYRHKCADLVAPRC